MSLNELGYQTVRVLHTCTICSAIYEPGREMTCSDACHEELMNRLIAQFGEFKKMVRMTTGETFKVPTRDIIEKGIRERTLDQYPKWED